jgi:hypothetical protein
MLEQHLQQAELLGRQPDRHAGEADLVRSHVEGDLTSPQERTASRHPPTDTHGSDQAENLVDPVRLADARAGPGGKRGDRLAVVPGFDRQQDRHVVMAVARPDRPNNGHAIDDGETSGYDKRRRCESTDFDERLGPVTDDDNSHPLPLESVQQCLVGRIVGEQQYRLSVRRACLSTLGGRASRPARGCGFHPYVLRAHGGRVGVAREYGSLPGEAWSSVSGGGSRDAEGTAAIVPRAHGTGADFLRFLPIGATASRVSGMAPAHPGNIRPISRSDPKRSLESSYPSGSRRSV